MAISGFYVGLYVVCKGLSALFSSPKKAEVGEGRREERTEGHKTMLRLIPFVTTRHVIAGEISSSREKRP